MNTILFFTIYSGAIAFIGLVSLLLNNKKTIQKALPPLSIFIISLLSAAYIIINFNKLNPNTILELLKWQIPFGKLQFGLDSLSGLFLIPLLLLTAATSIYGWKYFGHHKQEKGHWFYYTVLVSGWFWFFCHEMQ